MGLEGEGDGVLAYSSLELIRAELEERLELAFLCDGDHLAGKSVGLEGELDGAACVLLFESRHVHFHEGVFCRT